MIASFFIFGSGCVLSIAYLVTEHIYGTRALRQVGEYENSETILHYRVARVRGLHMKTIAHLARINEEITEELLCGCKEIDTVFEHVQFELNQEFDKVLRSLEQQHNLENNC